MRTYGYAGHIHAFMSRRGFLGGAARAIGLTAASELWVPARALADDHIPTVAPQPIPGGITVPVNPPVFIHHFPVTGITTNPFYTNDPSEITDFHGFVTNCRVTGGGTGTAADGTKSRLLFQVDNGFMDGIYVGVDGRTHEGTFGFI